MLDQEQKSSSSPGPSNDNLENTNRNNNIDAQQNGETLSKNKVTSDVDMFKEICGVDDETAMQLLQESGGDLEAAIHQFFFSRDYPEVLENQNNENHEELLRHRRPHHPSPVFGEINEEIADNLNQNLFDGQPHLPIYQAPHRQLTWIEMFKALVLIPFRLFYWTFSECINFFYHFVIGPPPPPAIGARGQNNRVQLRDYVDVVQDRILMNEQQNEYDRALAIDRQKAQERKRLEKQRLDDEKRINEAKEFARARTERLCRRREEIKAGENGNDAVLSSDSQSSEIIRIRITFPNGTRTERLFRENDKHFSLVTNFPVARLNCAPDWYLNEFVQKENGDVTYVTQNGLQNIKTFAEHGFNCSAVVMIQDEDA